MPCSRQSSTHRGQLVERLDRAAAEVVGVLHRHRSRRYQIGASRRSDDLGHLLQLQPAPSGGEGAHGHSLDRGMSPHLGTSDMGLNIADHFLARLDQQPYPEHVAHRTAHTEQTCLMPEQPSYALLQLVHCRVLGVHVISDRRGQHRLPHLLGWLGHGVRAQIDHGQESDEPHNLLGSGADRRPTVPGVDASLQRQSRASRSVRAPAAAGTMSETCSAGVVSSSRESRFAKSDDAVGYQRGARADRPNLKRKGHVGLDRV